MFAAKMSLMRSIFVIFFSSPHTRPDFKSKRKLNNTLKFEKYVSDSGQAYNEVKEKWQHKLKISDRPQANSPFVLKQEF